MLISAYVFGYQFQLKNKFSLTFIQFHTFALSLLQFSKFFINILDSFKLRQFWTRNTKAIAKDKKVNITVTYFDA